MINPLSRNADSKDWSARFVDEYLDEQGETVKCVMV